MGARDGKRRRIAPTNMPVRPTVDQIDPSMSGVPEHHRGRTGQVEFPNRFADRESFERAGRFGDDRGTDFRTSAEAWRFGLDWNRDGIARSYWRDLLATATGMIFAASLVTPQSFLDARRGLIGARISIGSDRFGLERHPGIKVQGALGAKSKSVLADRHVSRVAPVEIFLQRFANPCAYALA